ncbi:uncharacterized protein BT62DRAFT_937431 [Guyanagaster necrorhizus]|uniref:Uncharacterized protein n=1 Tax=Guyanagaster necrorhizus TaxID=856835 RepID=A0A9P7VHK9_9AGAR|nr:uncharacterized protein BT62DRAFT_937431 [Guyanagaster necrorhizus MCA 3950]KAG7441193.1 hypothetical protein BT62DRAFT_937431 [Guyanagaster necrorhizus MCA 3950]
MRTPFLLARPGGLGSISSLGEIPVHYVTSLMASVHDSKESMRTLSSPQIANLIQGRPLAHDGLPHFSPPTRGEDL